MSIRGALNISAVLLSAISGLLTFAVFVLHSFYSTAVAQWDVSEKFRAATETRLQRLEIETTERWRRVEADLHGVNEKLDKVLELKVKR
jgi:hypothetical protein